MPSHTGCFWRCRRVDPAGAATAAVSPGTGEPRSTWRLARHTDHAAPQNRLRLTLPLVSISEDSNITKTITENIEVKSVCASGGFFYGKLCRVL